MECAGYVVPYIIREYSGRNLHRIVHGSCKPVVPVAYASDTASHAPRRFQEITDMNAA